MNNESKNNLSKSNTLTNSSNIPSGDIKNNKDLNKSSVEYDEGKSEGCNKWNSVPRTYDKEESCHEHEKTATNNQWCSCNK